MGRALLHPSRKGIVTVERPEFDVLNLAVSSLMGALVATIRLPFPGRPTVVPLVMELQNTGLRTADMLNEMVLCEELVHSPSGRRIRGFHNRGPPRNLAHSQQTFPNLAAALLLPRKRVRAEAAAIRSVLDLFERRAQFDGPERCRAVRAHPCRCPIGSQTMLTAPARATFPFAQWGRAHGMPPRPSARQSADRQAPSVIAVPREGTQLQAIMDITAGRRTISALASI